MEESIAPLSSSGESSLHETQLYFDIDVSRVPVIFSTNYNISFLGLEKLHPFDSAKWGKIFNFLKEGEFLTDETVVEPKEAQEQDLLVVHTMSYLNSLKWSARVATITEVPPVACLPNWLVQRKVLKPFRFQVGGTILGGKLAMERGWAINLGGGFHHCSASHGGGFCAYADITLAIKFLFQRMADKVKKAMIIDLDAHQGNGHEKDFLEDPNVYILDIYNGDIYPNDHHAKSAIKRRVELQHYTNDTVYLGLVDKHVDLAFREFTPDFVLYNAGSDILAGDPLGGLSVSAEGIIARDQIVFNKVRSRGIPILMVTSGGYQRTTARIIADSILNLWSKQLIGQRS